MAKSVPRDTVLDKIVAHMSRVYEEVDPTYAGRCSDLVVCSTSQGFFREILEILLHIAKPEWLIVLQALPDNERVNFVKQNKEIMGSITEMVSSVQPLSRPKCARACMAKRQESLTCLNEGDYEKALALASQAVIKAPMKDDEDIFEGRLSLALSLWLRAEILMGSKQYAAALEDLQQAHKEGLPVKLRKEYYWHLGNCYKGINLNSKAKVSFEIALKLAEKDKLLKPLIQKDLESLKHYVPPIPPPNKPAIELTGGAKKNMPALSDLVKITEKEDKGRFAVAESAIKTGDVLLIDSPYATCLHSNFNGTHCQNCLRRFGDCLETAPIGCPNCSGVAFCSMKCRDIAMATFHLYECQFMDMFTGSGMSLISHLALRMVTQAGLQKSLSIHEKYIATKNRKLAEAATNIAKDATKKNPKKLTRRERLNRSRNSLGEIEKNLLAKQLAELNIDGKTSYDDFEVKTAQVYSLCTHSKHGNGLDYLKKFAMAAFLCECLKKAGFFDTCENEDDKTTAHSAIIELLVRNQQILQFNAHEIFETLHPKNTFVAYPLHTGLAIYPTGSLFNHDCNPAVMRYFKGVNIVLTAIRPIAPGDEVSENYGPTFLTRTRTDRQRVLASRYWFTCKCKACEEDWPTIKDLKDNCVFFRCQNPCCRAVYRVHDKEYPRKCSKCKSNVDSQRLLIAMNEVNKCISQYEDGIDLMRNEKLQDAIVALSAAIDKFHGIAHPPQKDTHIVQDMLKSCLAIQGNVHILKKPPARDQKRKTT